MNFDYTGEDSRFTIWDLRITIEKQKDKRDSPLPGLESAEDREARRTRREDNRTQINTDQNRSKNKNWSHAPRTEKRRGQGGADKDKIQKLKAKDRNKAINKRTIGMNKKG